MTKDIKLDFYKKSDAINTKLVVDVTRDNIINYMIIVDMSQQIGLFLDELSFYIAVNIRTKG